MRMCGWRKRSVSVWSCIFFPVYQNNLNVFLYISTGLGFLSVFFFFLLAGKILGGVSTVLDLVSTMKDEALYLLSELLGDLWRG